MSEIKVKPFWQSTSFWITVATIVSVIVTSGLLPEGSSVERIGLVLVQVMAAMGLVAKRGYVEAQTIKANAILEAAKIDPTKP